MEKTINLYWKDILLINLSYEKDMYVQHFKTENLETAQKEGCPVGLLFHNKTEKIVKTKHLPIIFDEYNFSKSRTDLITAYNIEKNDSIFEKLYKIAQKSNLISHNGFWISTC